MSISQATRRGEIHDFRQLYHPPRDMAVIILLSLKSLSSPLTLPLPGTSEGILECWQLCRAGPRRWPDAVRGARGRLPRGAGTTVMGKRIQMAGGVDKYGW